MTKRNLEDSMRIIDDAIRSKKFSSKNSMNLIYHFCTLFPDKAKNNKEWIKELVQLCESTDNDFRNDKEFDLIFDLIS